MNLNHLYIYLQHLSPLAYLTIFILSFVIVVIVSLFNTLENTLFILSVVVITIILGYYYYGINIGSSVNKNMDKTELDVVIKTNVPRDGSKPKHHSKHNGQQTHHKGRKQVFHLSDNKYTYKDAKGVCAAYGGRLANWRDVDTAYKHGAEWCGYGWSEDQMALFPTQYKTWEKLQTIDGHEHDCGRPGINGGYIANPRIKFGVNCYGHKPPIKMSHHKKIDVTEISPDPDIDDSLYPGNKWADKLDEIDISPFNRKRWSM